MLNILDLVTHATTLQERQFVRPSHWIKVSRNFRIRTVNWKIHYSLDHAFINSFLTNVRACTLRVVRTFLRAVPLNNRSERGADVKAISCQCRFHMSVNKKIRLGIRLHVRRNRCHCLRQPPASRVGKRCRSHQMTCGASWLTTILIFLLGGKIV